MEGLGLAVCPSSIAKPRLLKTDFRRQTDDETETHRDLCRGMTLRFQPVVCRRSDEAWPQGDGEPCDSPLTETAGCDDRDTLQWHLDLRDYW